MRIRKCLFIPLTIAMIGAMGCTGNNQNAKTETTVASAQTEVATTATQTESEVTSTQIETEVIVAQTETETDATATQTETAATTALGLTEDEIMEKVQDYFYSQNPDLKDSTEETEYAAWYPCDSEDSNVLKIAHKAYTGAFTFFYVDLTSGDTYVTEYVPGIIDDEQETGETFNVK